MSDPMLGRNLRLTGTHMLIEKKRVTFKEELPMQKRIICAFAALAAAGIVLFGGGNRYNVANMRQYVFSEYGRINHIGVPETNIAREELFSRFGPVCYMECCFHRKKYDTEVVKYYFQLERSDSFLVADYSLETNKIIGYKMEKGFRLWNFREHEKYQYPPL